MLINQEIEQAKKVILAGGIVALPTETVYGLAASIDSEAGIKNIFAIKERPLFDPLIVHICELRQKDKVISSWPAIADWLASKFWPGPLTMVLPKKNNLNPLITAGLDTVGIRMPSHPAALALIKACDIPLAAPSANKFGKTSPTKAEHVRKSFEKENIYILDGGQSEVGLESTVVGIYKENDIDVVEIYRPGAVTEEQLRDALQTRNEPFLLRRKASLASPGNTEHHYMPNIPLVIIEQEPPGLKQKTKEEIARDFQMDINERGAELRLDPNPKLAARSLYVRMRECAEMGVSYIYVFKRAAQSGGVWDAIWDRLQRAASRQY